MRRVMTQDPVTDDEILAYDNVPVKVAARYIGWSTTTLYNALQDERAPFGFASVNEDAKTYSGCSNAYNISPGLLVAYKRGTLACPNPGKVVRDVMSAVQDMLTKGRIIRIPGPVATMDGEEVPRRAGT